jgi:hypothetical protein
MQVNHLNNTIEEIIKLISLEYQVHMLDSSLVQLEEGPLTEEARLQETIQVTTQDLY